LFFLSQIHRLVAYRRANGVVSVDDVELAYCIAAVLNTAERGPVRIGPKQVTNWPGLDAGTFGDELRKCGIRISRSDGEAILAKVIKRKKPIGKVELGKRLKLTQSERLDPDVDARNIAPFDLDDAGVEQQRRERDAKSARERRAAAGAVPRDEYLANALSQKQPWLDDGCCRRTWERNRGADEAAGKEEAKAARTVTQVPPHVASASPTRRAELYQPWPPMDLRQPTESPSLQTAEAGAIEASALPMTIEEDGMAGWPADDVLSERGTPLGGRLSDADPASTVDCELPPDHDQRSHDIPYDDDAAPIVTSRSANHQVQTLAAKPRFGAVIAPKLSEGPIETLARALRDDDEACAPVLVWESGSARPALRAQVDENTRLKIELAKAMAEIADLQTRIEALNTDDAFTITPEGSAAIGVEHVEPDQPPPKPRKAGKAGKASKDKATIKRPTQEIAALKAA